MITRRLTLSVAFLALLAAASLAAEVQVFDRATQMGPNPVLPEPNSYLIPPMRIAKPVGWQNGETPKVPDGFKIEALASGLAHPRQPYVLPNGDVLVVEADGPGLEKVKRPKSLIMALLMGAAGAEGKTENRISIIHDGKASVFLDGLYSPFGVVLVGNDLYVANTDAIMRYPYKDGDLKITEPGQKFIDLPGGPIDHHWTKSLTASADGSKLYVGIGSNSNVMENGEQAELDRAQIWEVDRTTGAHRPYATGLRNPNGLNFYPGSQTLWTVVNERDELGPNLVPDYMTSVKDGAFYGWPYSYYGQHLDPRVNPQKPDLVARAIPPDFALSSHVAPLGLAFNSGNSFPDKYKGGAFVGEHGSWDRDEFNGYQVGFIAFNDGKPSGTVEPFVTGFLNDREEARGRPVGVAFDTSGALIIADDLGNTVWRVSADR